MIDFGREILAGAATPPELKGASFAPVNNFVPSCQQVVDNLLTSWKQAVRTHPDDNLLDSIATSMLQICYNLCHCVLLRL